MEPYQEFFQDPPTQMPSPPFAVEIAGRQKGKMHYAHEQLRKMAQAGEKCLYFVANEAQASAARKEFKDYPSVHVAWLGVDVAKQGSSRVVSRQWTAQEIEEIGRQEQHTGSLYPGQLEDVLFLWG